MKRRIALIVVVLMTLFASGTANASFSERDWQGPPPDCC